MADTVSGRRTITATRWTSIFSRCSSRRLPAIRWPMNSPAPSRDLALRARMLADDNGRIPLIGDDDGGELWPTVRRSSNDIGASLAVAGALVERPELAVGRIPEEAYWLLSQPSLSRRLEDLKRAPGAGGALRSARRYRLLRLAIAGRRPHDHRRRTSRLPERGTRACRCPLADVDRPRHADAHRSGHRLLHNRPRAPRPHAIDRAPQHVASRRSIAIGRRRPVSLGPDGRFARAAMADERRVRLFRRRPRRVRAAANTAATCWRCTAT